MGVTKFRKIALCSVPFLAVLLLAVSPRAYAAPIFLHCLNPNEVEGIVCDLSLDKQVSVNGGAFVDADTSGAAASAHVGDTVTWKVTVTNTSSDGLIPWGDMLITDVLPSGFTLGSSSPSAGTFGVYNANTWALPLLNSDENTNLPATLTLTTTATTSGLAKNTATISTTDSYSCDGGCPYNDSDPDNNSNDAFVNISAAPQVLGTSTTTPQVLALVNTGSGAVESIIAALLIAVTVGVTFYGRTPRAKRIYKLYN